MKIEISPEERVSGIIDLVRFEEVMKGTRLDLEAALFASVVIEKNETTYSEEKIKRILFAEIDWTPVFMNLKDMDDGLRLIHFKICPITFKDKVEYLPYSRNKDYSKVELREKRNSGRGYIVINSFNYKPEHNIDVWISKSTFPYPENEWVEIIK